MIVTEIIELDGKNFKHIYSDQGYFIQKVGTDEVYPEAYDVMESDFKYIETDQINEDSFIFKLKLTRGDVFRGLLRAKGITRAQIRALIEALPQETQQQQLERELALIDFDEALYFYRANPLFDQLGEPLNITPQQMTKFFETSDWQELIN